MSLHSLLKKNPIVVTKNTSAKEAAQKMLKENVGTVIVVEKEGSLKPCGILTDRDIALKFAESDLNDKLLVKDIATTELFSLQQGHSVKELSAAFCDNKVRRIVILNDQNNLAGLVSVDDLLVVLVSELQDIKKTIESQVCW